MIRSTVLLFACLFVSCKAYSQSYNYWTVGFNEESSLLSGAVVGGGAGPGAIFYNPSSISEITESKLSLHGSLFAIEFYDFQNALGPGIGINTTKTIIYPRFISYMIRSKRRPNLSFEVAFLNNEDYNVDFSGSVDSYIDILKDIKGTERYFVMYQFLNYYKDNWFGLGCSQKINSNLSIGASMFVSVKQLEYQLNIDIEAFPLTDSVYVGNELLSAYSATHQIAQAVTFSNYRLLFKLGLMYKKNNFSLGLCIQTPSMNIFSNGKKIANKEEQSNISSPYSGGFLPDYVIADFQEKKEVDVNYKDPFSIAAGFTYYASDKKKTFFSTIEYFSGIDPYKFIEANENPNLSTGSVFDDINYNEWLSFVHGAKPVLNAAVGYRWRIKEKLMLLTGIRTDFNYRKNIDYGEYSTLNVLKGLDLDLYHITAGVNVTIFNQDLITGFQYSFGTEKHQREFIYLAEPVEYNTAEEAPLQGTRENNMNLFYNALSLYFGATFNLGKNKD